MKLSKIKKSITDNWLLIIFVLALAVFFRPFLLEGKLPVPADTIVGMYHPWRDAVWDNFTAGVPFKNFLITDPVRQQYPWRMLTIDQLEKGQMPLWNPYIFAGEPLLAGLQSAAFYPLNFAFALLPFNLVWGFLISLQPFLAGVFLYLYLAHLKLKREACLLGAFTFAFSGFFIAWLEWGTILHVALWLPLVLLAIDKIVGNQKYRWDIVFLFSLAFSFFAGHLQTSFYLVLFSLFYLTWRLVLVKKGRGRLVLRFLVLYLLFIGLTSIQWWPTLEFIKLSARGVDQAQFNQPGWFFPWQHLVQFLVPDFFGNPTTLNYWGVFNYAEFIGYIGVIPLILAIFALFWRRDKLVLFFGFFAFLWLSFSLPTFWGKLPYQLRFPLISTSQPTRLVFLVDFCLAVLAAFGLDAFLRKKTSIRKMALTLAPFLFFYGLFWLFVVLAKNIWPEALWIANLEVSKRNLVLPSGILIAFTTLFSFWCLIDKICQGKKTAGYSRRVILSGLFLITVFDLFRFGWKFTPFVKKDWLFPATKTVEFLQSDKGVFRFMTTDRRVFPPNFSLPYKLQAIAGYNPLYLSRYAELIAASERGEADIAPPFGFNRIITPHNYESKIINLLNVKYVLSLDEETSPKLTKVFEEGQTKVYENLDVLPRAFIVYQSLLAKNKQEAIELLMAKETDLGKTVILEEFLNLQMEDGDNQVEIKSYQENRVVIGVETSQPGILVLTDSYYPGWEAIVNGEKIKIYRADYHFRGVVVPEGTYEVVFRYGKD